MFTFIKNIRNIVTLVAAIIALLSAGWGFYQTVLADAAKDERDNAITELSVKTTEVTTYKNELGQTVTEVKQYQKHVSDLETSNDSLEIQAYKAIKASKLKDKQLKEAYAIQIEATNAGPLLSFTEQPLLFSGPEFSPVVDSLQMDSIKTFTDGFLSVIVSADSLSYEYEDKLTLIKARRMVPRKFAVWRWIGWQKVIDRDMVEITSNNPKNKINGRLIKLE